MASGIPRVNLDESQTMGAVLSATADFRDQYYGLVGFVEDANGRVPDGVSTAALITTGLIDPAELHWGNRSTKFNKTDYTAPLVDLNRLRSESELGDWAANRLVPKLLLATQTRVIEVVVDEAGVLLPSVPVITVTTHGISLWHTAAALMSPPITAWAAARYMGVALNIDALKLSASQVLSLPLPARSVTWDTAAALIRDASGASSSQKRTRIRYKRQGSLMCDAYRVSDADQLMNLVAWPPQQGALVVKFSVETWAPEYGLGLDIEQMEESKGDVDVDVEIDADDWSPKQPKSPELPDSVLFVDGVRRIDVRIWITDGELVRSGVCASVAAGAVKCAQSEAHVVDLAVKRAVYASASEAAGPIVTRHGTYEFVPCASDAPE